MWCLIHKSYLSQLRDTCDLRLSAIGDLINIRRTAKKDNQGPMTSDQRPNFMQLWQGNPRPGKLTAEPDIAMSGTERDMFRSRALVVDFSPPRLPQRCLKISLLQLLERFIGRR
jgi:hypothetical protein